MSSTQNLLGGRYQFIQALNSHPSGQTFLAADIHYPGHPKCVVREVHLPTRNPMTRQFILTLLKKKVAVLEEIGRHSQIPNTFAAFDVEQSFYIVQEYIPGRSLREELIAGNPWPARMTVRFLQEVLPVLNFAQSHGVVHGNLKPSKLIRHQNDKQLVLLDFGSIKNLSQNFAGKGKLNGRQALASAAEIRQIYLAPEQARNQTSFCSDHYAVGMMLIQAVTGLPSRKLPAAEEPGRQERLAEQLQAAPDCPSGLMGVLLKMVHTDPGQRYQKAADVLNDVERLQSNPTVAVVDEPTLASLEADEIEEMRPRCRWPWGWIGGLGLASLVAVTALIALKLPQRVMAGRHLAAAESLQVENPEAAIERYSEALAVLPYQAEALAERSRLYFNQGNTEAALADISEAIAQAPKVPTYAYERANLRFAVGDVQGAIDDYTQALGLDAAFTKAYINRGSARADWGDDRGAVDDYTEAIAQAETTEIEAAAYLNRCLSYSNLGEQELALADCTAAINLRPSHALAYQNRGLVRRRLGDFQGSLQDYNIAIQIDPNSPDPYYNRGLTREVLNDLTGAMDDFSRAIAIDPEFVFAIYDRGLLNAELNNTAAAIADLQAAAQICLDLDRTGCYEDAQYQIARLQGEPVTSDPPSAAEPNLGP
ncbi:MAG: tetratricopeptide repeat protein [Leptolyngbyaceae cyanobacterium]